MQLKVPFSQDALSLVILLSIICRYRVASISKANTDANNAYTHAGDASGEGIKRNR